MIRIDINFLLLVSLAHLFCSDALTNLQLGSSVGPITTSCNKYTYFAVQAKSSCKDLMISVLASKGNPDVYAVKSKSYQKPIYPTKDMLTWAAYKAGSDLLNISHWDPEFNTGLFYIGVYAECSNSNTAAIYSINVTEATNDYGDLLKNPQLGINQKVAANGYTYYKFCLESNCAKATIVPTYINTPYTSAHLKQYVNIDLILSRTKRYPLVDGHVIHFWNMSLTTDVLNPSYLDNNGFLSGTYYLAMFGWCTSSEFCTNNATCGPCSNYGPNGAPYNLTASVIQLNSSSCATQTIQTVDPNTMDLSFGETYQGSISCTGSTQYFRVEVPDPCNNMNILLGNSGNLALYSTDIYIGKAPLVQPNPYTLGWANFFWGNKNLTISAWDPAFKGGYNCGLNGESLCIYYIGIVPYCLASGSMQYNLTVSLTRAHAIFGIPQTNQLVAASALRNSYNFCVSNSADVLATLTSFQNTCPVSSYRWLDMIISPTYTTPTLNSLGWHMGRTQNSISLKTTLPNFRTGQYYVSVIGSCNTSLTATACPANTCSCGACATLTGQPYTLAVDWASSVTPVPTVAPTRPTAVPSSAPSSVRIQPASLTQLSDGAIAGIVIAAFIVVIATGSLTGLVICCCFMPSRGSYSEAPLERPGVAVVDAIPPYAPRESSSRIL